MFAGINQRAGDLSVRENALFPVHILEKQIQRNDTLRETAINTLPLRLWNDPGNQVEREQSFRAAPIAVYREGDSLEEKREVGMLTALLELRRHHRGQFFKNLGIMRARLIGSREHFVIKRPDLIIAE